MKAVVCNAPGDLRLAERPDPPPPGPGQARVRVARVGICGTDYHIFEGRHPFLAYPRVMGHEVSGRVEVVGEGVALEPGAPVAVNPYLSCGRCVACRKGRPNCCTAIAVLGVHVDGAMAEAITLPAENLYPTDGLSLEAAAAVEFLAIGAHAARRSAAPPGSRALVIGAGPIGLGVALFARLDGQEVALADTDPERLAFAADRLGLASVFRAGPQGAAGLAAATGGDGFDVVYDATGNAASMEAAFGHVAHGGTLVMVGVVKDDIRFSDPEFHKREMTVMASRNAVRADFARVMAAIRTGDVPVEALVTHRTDLAAVPRDLPRWAADKRGLVKAMIRVGSD